jgi:hypothetical protein
MTLLLKPGATYYGRLYTHSPITDAAADADSLPTITVYKNNAAYATMSIVPADAGDGYYTLQAAVPAACPVGSTLAIVANFTMSGAVRNQLVDTIQVVTANAYDSLVAGSDSLDVTSPFTNLAKIVVSENPLDPIGIGNAPPLGDYTYNGSFFSLPQCNADGPEGTWVWSSRDYGTRWRIGVTVDATSYYQSPVNEPFGVYTLTGDVLVGYVGSVVVSPNADAPFKAAMIGFLPMAGDALAVPLPNRSEAADAVCDEALSGHTTSGTVGKAMNNVGTPVALDGGTATLAGMLTKIADDSGGSAYDATTDSLKLKTPGLSAADTRTALGMADADLDDQLDAILAAGGASGAAADATAAKLETMLEADGLNYRFTGGALDNVDCIGMGAGGTENTITVTDDDSNPLDGVAVWVTTDEAGSNVIQGTYYTDAMGQVTVSLQAPGTYYVWRQLAGYNFDENPYELELT